MVGAILVALAFQVGGDTVTVDVRTALERGVETSADLAVARLRLEAAEGRSAQARAWPNPTLTLSAENVGQQRAFTGISGWRGLEGQAILRAPLPFGAERSGTSRASRAAALEAEARLRAQEIDTRASLLRTFGESLRHRAAVDAAREELASLTELASQLTTQAEAGRASAAEAARARLARGMATTQLARLEATLATDGAELARLLGLPAGTRARLEAPSCAAVGRGSSRMADSSPSLDRVPEIRAAEARTAVAAGATEYARGLARPDLSPEVGLRRSQGLSGLYLGASTELPLLDRGRRRVDAALHDETAAQREQLDVERRWESASAGASEALGALEGGGAHFDEGWFDDLERVVRAAEARFRLGEGTLAELLSARSARLDALRDYQLWQSEWWAARAEWTRMAGRTPSADLLCRDPYMGGD